MKVLGNDPAINQRRMGNLTSSWIAPPVSIRLMGADVFQRCPLPSHDTPHFGREFTSLSAFIDTVRASTGPAQVRTARLSADEQKIIVSQARAEGFLRMPPDVAGIVMRPDVNPGFLSRVVDAATKAHRELPDATSRYADLPPIWLRNTIHRPLTLPSHVPDMPWGTDNPTGMQKKQFSPWLDTILTMLTQPGGTYHLHSEAPIDLKALSENQREFLKGFTTMAHYLGKRFVYDGLTAPPQNNRQSPFIPTIRPSLGGTHRADYQSPYQALIENIQTAHELGLADAVNYAIPAVSKREVAALKAAVKIPVLTELNTAYYQSNMQDSDMVSAHRAGYDALIGDPLALPNGFKTIHQHPLDPAWHQADQNLQVAPMVVIRTMVPSHDPYGFLPRLSDQADFIAHILSASGLKQPILDETSHQFDYGLVTNLMALRYGTPQLRQVLSAIEHREEIPVGIRPWIRHPDMTLDTIVAAKAHAVLNGGAPHWTYWSTDHKTVSWAIENPQAKGTVLMVMNTVDPHRTKEPSPFSIPTNFLQDKNLRPGHALILDDITGIRIDHNNIFDPHVERPITLKPSEMALFYFDSTHSTP